jgi:hypothetical protein
MVPAMPDDDTHESVKMGPLALLPTEHHGKTCKSELMNHESRKPIKLIPRMRNEIRLKGYSYSTEKNYVKWVRDFILFHQ